MQLCSQIVEAPYAGLIIVDVRSTWKGYAQPGNCNLRYYLRDAVSNVLLEKWSCAHEYHRLCQEASAMPPGHCDGTSIV